MSLNTEPQRTRPFIILDIDQAKMLLKRAVEERGADFVYRTLPDVDAKPCVYFDPETECPACLIGHVLSYKGLSYADIGAYNHGTGVAALREAGIIRTDTDTAELLSIAQQKQDAGWAWGKAVQYALDNYAR